MSEVSITMGSGGGSKIIAAYFWHHAFRENVIHSIQTAVRDRCSSGELDRLNSIRGNACIAIL